MGNDCWYYRAQYAGMTKVCMRKSTVERGRIVRFGLCPKPPDSEAWRRCGFAIGQHEIPLMVERWKMNSAECPLCWGEGRLCKSQTTDPGGCPKRSENLGCDGCEEFTPCSLCKGEGYVSQAKLNRWYEEMAEIRWGECKPDASELVENRNMED